MTFESRMIEAGLAMPNDALARALADSQALEVTLRDLGVWDMQATRAGDSAEIIIRFRGRAVRVDADAASRGRLVVAIREAVAMELAREAIENGFVR